MKEFFPQDWLIIKEKNLFNLDNENIIKHIEKYDEKLLSENNINKYIFFGYNLLIRRAKLSEHWVVDATFNFTKGFEQLLILCSFDKITNKFFPLYLFKWQKRLECYILKFSKKYLNI